MKRTEHLRRCSPASRPALLGVTLALLVLIAGCGGSSLDPTSGASMTVSPSPPAVDLAVTVMDDTPAEPLTALLRCGGAGTSTHPQTDAACAAVLAAGPAGFDPVPADAMCTEIFGGPQVARVSGTVEGVAVDTEFRRTNGCEIARWDALAPLFDLG